MFRKKAVLGLENAEKVFQIATERGHDPKLIMTGAIVGAELFGHAVTYRNEASAEAEKQSAKATEHLALVPTIRKRVERAVNALLAKIDALRRQIERMKQFGDLDVAEQERFAAGAKRRAEFVKTIGEL